MDLTKETVIPISKADKHFPSRPHKATIQRWADPEKGVRGHVLESIIFGGRRYTSEEAIQRFIAHLNGVKVTSETHDQATTELDEAGC